jgi:hypothetical protein
MDPRKKEAARTIKRIVTKRYTMGKYKMFKGVNSGEIKAGQKPTAASALMRRMKMFPVTVNVPIYRGLSNSAGRAKRLKQNTIYNSLIKEGGEFKNSFASFTTNEKFARVYGYTGLVLVLPPGRYPAINSKKFGHPKNKEAEITLAPGVYKLNKTRNINNNGSTKMVPVTFTPFKNFYAYVPQLTTYGKK